MSKPIVAYHWWSFPEEPPVYQNLRAPILISIATLRSVSDVPIFVLDGSEHIIDWGYFPDKLKFKIIKTPLYFQPYKSYFEGWRHLSRIPDIHNWSVSLQHDCDIIYVDSDVFFFQDPIPAICNTNKFCWDGWNTGYFYFNQTADLYQDFYKKFNLFCHAAIYSQEIRGLVEKYVGYDTWYGVCDEMILGLMKNENPNLFNYISNKENVTVRSLKSISNPIMLHANGLMVENPLTGEKHARGLLGVLITEFYNNLKNVLNEDDLSLIYGKMLNFGKKNQFSILENIQNLEKTKDNLGHYHVSGLLNQISFV